MKRIRHRKASRVLVLIGLLLLASVLALLLIAEKKLSVRMLYLTSETSFDTAAYGQLQQSLVANLELERRAWDQELTEKRLQTYHSIYLDPSLHERLTEAQQKLLEGYVAKGGHLFLENTFAADFPAEFLGAQAIVDVKAPDEGPLTAARLNAQQSGTAAGTEGKELRPDAGIFFTFPEPAVNLRSLQELLISAADHLVKHDTENSWKHFSWGKGMIPSTAQPLMTLKGTDIALYSLNRFGKGTVFLSGTLLPNRYFPTGYDLAGGMDPKLGFDRYAAVKNTAKGPVQGALYFDRSQLPVEPFFHFTFAAESALFRSEYAAFVAKELYGYSVKKVLGPYGRPAMAHQNHFEAWEAIRDGEGIRWAEMLREYQQIPSFSLVRSAFRWGQWVEGVAVHLNTGTQAAPAFAGESPSSHYSSGLRLMTTDGPLRLAPYPTYRSLGDRIELPYRAYPALADLNGDGRADLIVGSGDGSLQAYMNAGTSAAAYEGQPLPAGIQAPPFVFGAPEPLRQTDGTPLAVGSYASVAAYDLNADGRPDLIIGSADGTLLAAYGEAGGRYSKPAPLRAGGQPIRAAGPVAAAVGDVTGDGIPDLVVGDGGGQVTLYKGQRSTSGALAWLAGTPLVRVPAPFAAPSVRDMDGDGRADLVVGNLEGDLRVYLQTAQGDFREAGTLQGASMNQLGSHALVGGHNSVPLWYDVNADGKDDLIVGQLEFGLAMPIDHPQFPLKEQLNEFIRYTKEHYLELYPHIFVHNYTSNEQEKQEIALHREAFEKLGIPWRMTGTNQHTWRISHPDRLQTLRNEREADIWFNFGFRSPYAPNDPRLGFEYDVSLPFLMTDSEGLPELQQPMLLHTPAPVLRTRQKQPMYSTEDLFETYTALDLPIDYFEHVEYQTIAHPENLLEFVRYLDKLRDTHDYNFMTEQQMARSFLNTLTTKVEVYRSWGTVLADRIKKALHLPTSPSFLIRQDTSRVPDQAAEYKGTLGLVVDPGGFYMGRTAATNAEVHDTKAGKLYLGAAAGASTLVSFEQQAEQASDMHLIRVNVPYKLNAQKNRWTLELNAPGMQQVKLYSSAPLQFEGPDGMTVEQDKQQNTYTITHFGDRTTITMTMP
ncbi:FG-GAP repeat domain-containing protein [Paenibacillus silviterrae]|uniref:FG-GAP repeat domain-containing protein n=1 Tax=Paenibacillus silviterrae TaxID=3242194 RepID=UPI002543AF7D|nr:VCBS repeat-containing protein [Paenibacillus chinjuensis]